MNNAIWFLGSGKIRWRSAKDKTKKLRKSKMDTPWFCFNIVDSFLPHNTVEEEPEDASPRSPTSGFTELPGEIKTELDAKIVYNAPFSEKNRYTLRIANLGTRRRCSASSAPSFSTTWRIRTTTV
ncbi:MAG: hypothetical protein GY696_05610 [Gammaproteobacteria bacterium]|nr:hypothetical protein [Gammaproteobacteria bacterium]